MDHWTQPLEFCNTVRAGRIYTADVPGLDATMLRAWNTPHRWHRCGNYDDGVKRVICIPKVSKAGTRYWLWGYDLTVGKIHWQNTKYPYDAR